MREIVGNTENLGLDHFQNQIQFNIVNWISLFI